MSGRKSLKAEATETRRSRLVGLIAAAGRATRLAPLPCSKELVTVGFQPGTKGARPKVVSQYLIEQMRDGGADHIYVILRSGKWDILDYYGDGSRLGLRFAYLITGDNYGPPFTLSEAAPFVTDAVVLFGFPDILMHPRNLFAPALEKLDSTSADVVLGVFPAKYEDGVDLVETSADGRVTRLSPKEQNPVWTTPHGLAWIIAVWRPSFTAFLREEVERLGEVARAQKVGVKPEWPVGSVIAAAVAAGLHVNTVVYEGGRFLDIGKPDNLVKACNFPGVWNGIDA